MLRTFSLWLLLMCVFIRHAAALSVGYDGSDLPFTETFDRNAPPPTGLVLQVVNPSNDAVVVMAWQLQLELRPVAGAQGELLFESIGTPPDSLFGTTPGPQSDLTNASNVVLAFDGDTIDFDGEPVRDESARNIIELSLVATPNASGAFQLVMPEFDAENPDAGSSWFPADGFEPVAFDNAAASAFSGFVLLGTLNVTPVRPDGDYDSDGEVGPSDYVRWRSHFGNVVSTPGEEADGNRNLIVDGADYVVWRTNLPTTTGKSVERVPPNHVPEPHNTVLATIGLGGTVFLRNRPRLSRFRHF